METLLIFSCRRQGKQITFALKPGFTQAPADEGIAALSM